MKIPNFNANIPLSTQITNIDCCLFPSCLRVHTSWLRGYKCLNKDIVRRMMLLYLHRAARLLRHWSDEFGVSVYPFGLSLRGCLCSHTRVPVEFNCKDKLLLLYHVMVVDWNLEYVFNIFAYCFPGLWRWVAIEQPPFMSLYFCIVWLI